MSVRSFIAVTSLPSSLAGDINPGNAIQVKAAFDVPPGTVPSELEVHDSMFSGGATVRLS